jgi:hypothetical protein
MTAPVENTTMSNAPRRALGVLVASLFVACAPGACTTAPQIEVCKAFAGDHGVCEQPQGGLAAGVRYTAFVAGPSLPEGEVVLAIYRVRDDGTEQRLASIDIERAKGDAPVTRPLIFPELGRYRLEVRTSDGRLLGQRTFEATIPTVR